MCTVTFIPTPEKVFITSNRDESPGRQSAGLISLHPPDKNIIHYPLDETSGGSWIALSDSGRAVCLLNGGFQPFHPDPPYRQSRGLVVLDAALEPEDADFLESYDLNRIAPFTLLVYENKILRQLVWDGDQRHITELPSDLAQIWSSVTLYPEDVRQRRKASFEKWLIETPSYNRESIIEFHQQTNGDPQNDFIMNRNEIVKTLSITNIILKENAASILHLGLEKQTREEIMVKYE